MFLCIFIIYIKNSLFSCVLKNNALIPLSQGSNGGQLDKGLTCKLTDAKLVAQLTLQSNSGFPPKLLIGYMR